MFLAGGYVYVYLSYGVHACINIVTGPAGEGQAILLRALEPLTGLDAMARRRNLTSPLQLTSGPGKLTQALGISLSLSGTHLGAALMLKPPRVDYNPGPIATGPRIGITKATDRPWRYYLRDSPFLSRRSPLE
jgi:DNA-3-methyladenine glycosylase